jgi:gluconokinase
VILAVDIGTSSTRAVLYDAETAKAIPGGGHTIAHDPDVTADGGATLDADALVGEAVFCIRTVLDAIGTQTARDIRAVAVCTFWHSCVGVDARGAARTPVLLWSDRRSDEQVARLRREIDAAAYTERTGCPVHTSYLPGGCAGWRTHSRTCTARAPVSCRRASTCSRRFSGSGGCRARFRWPRRVG